MPLMPVTDSMFLLVESREHPMHVGGLQLFRKPPDAGPNYLADLRHALLAEDNIRALFRRRPARPVNTIGQLAWSEDTELDLDYHFRHSALPQPGRIRELLELTSRWHSTLLDRHRPLWEVHLVEGVSDDRFALYSKVHHALLDGVSALRHMQATLSDDPDARDCPPPWGSRQRPREATGTGSLFGSASDVFGQLAGLAPAAIKIANEALREHTLTLPMQAPRTMLNVPIGGARRFAAQSWPTDRVRAVASAAGVARNDVVLAMCAGALRDYLIEQGGLPDAPLIAMVPVSLRGRDRVASAELSGNAVGALLCNLATDRTDPAARLATINQSMTDGKRLMAGLSPLQMLALSAMNVAALGVSTVPGFGGNTPPPFNLLISNVPGPRKRMYWNGAELDGIYPASLLLDGQALNITLTNTADNLDFGITGCRRSVPHLQRILTHLDTALAELEAATGIEGSP